MNASPRSYGSTLLILDNFRDNFHLQFAEEKIQSSSIHETNRWCFQETLEQRTDFWVKLFTHSHYCKDVNCTVPKCSSMMEIALPHFRTCEQSECQKCQALFFLCYHHASSCNNWECIVLFCNDFKHAELRYLYLIFKFNCKVSFGIISALRYFTSWISYSTSINFF